MAKNKKTEDDFTVPMIPKELLNSGKTTETSTDEPVEYSKRVDKGEQPIEPSTESTDEIKNDPPPIEQKNSEQNKSSREMFEIVEWYKLNAEHLVPQHLQLLMQKRGKLAAYAVDYAKAILKFGKEYAKHHVDRSINVKIKSTELQSKVDPDAANGKTYTNARAVEIATIANEETYRLEYMAEANRDGHTLILRTINNVLDSMKQDIAEMRSIRGDNDKTEADVK